MMEVFKTLLLLLCVIICLSQVVQCDDDDHGDDGHYTNSWAVEISGGDEVADAVAATHGFTNVGKVGSLENYYHFIDHERDESLIKRSLEPKHINLMRDHKVMSAEQQIGKRRDKRHLVSPHDSMWGGQWYLNRAREDMNVRRVWDMGVTGKGIVVTILDDGLEHDHPDLAENYDPLASHDYNGHDPDPIPRYDPTNENKHGTRCAGEVAAGLNNVCAVGVAYHAKIGGVRMLDANKITDAVEGSSLSFSPQHVDIYSSSWGPTDNGRTVDGPARLAKKAFLDGVTTGRGGKGSIYVWASGNGGSRDNCNCDGYAVSPFTVSIGSVSESGSFPWYAEECSSNLATTYSSGSSRQRRIISTDLHHGCTDHHTGTSAAAPMAAGIIALALQVNPNLTWRDVQYIIVYSSNPSVPRDDHWITNGAGLKVSLKYGFGLMDAAALVNRARYWTNVPPRLNCTISVNLDQHSRAASTHQIPIDITNENCPIKHVEHVQAITTLIVNTGRRGNVQISLRSPSNTLSMLLKKRPYDSTMQGFNDWPFMTVMSWGESAQGRWLYTAYGTELTMKSLTLIVYGISEVPKSVRDIPEKCSSECSAGCSKEGRWFCDECKALQVQSSLECVSTCPTGTYHADDYCLDCPDNCIRCTGDKSCDECSGNAYKLPSGLCAQSCAPSTVLIEGTCHPCHLSCMSCNGVTEENCTQCHEGPYKLIDGRCEIHTNCTSAQYFDHRELSCRNCHESCVQCSGRQDSECTLCSPSQELEDGHCVGRFISCQNGEYFNNETDSCALCSPDCAMCTNDMTCTECSSEHYLYSIALEHSDLTRSFCIESCPEGYFNDDDTGNCTECSPDCGTCSDDPDFCTSCIISNVIPYKGLCPDLCHSSEYFDYSTQSCKNCSKTCLTCSNATSCTTCPTGLYLDVSTNQCLSHCTNGTTENPSTRLCELVQCHSSCLTCSGSGSESCLSCPDHLVLFQSTCRESCPTGWYLTLELACFQCHGTCKTCAGGTEGECLTCADGLFLDNYHCLNSCRKGSYPAMNYSCHSCLRNCADCNVDGCISCNDGFNLNPDGDCHPWCPGGYYSHDGKCYLNITNSPSTTASTTNLPTDIVTEELAPSPSLSIFLIFLSFIGMVSIFSVLVLLVWKRRTIILMLKRNSTKYVMLYTHPDEMELNHIDKNIKHLTYDIDDSESETELFNRSKPF